MGFYVQMLNSFLTNQGIDIGMSPRKLLTKQKLNYNLHYKVTFVYHTYTHKENLLRKSLTNDRNLGAIFLIPTKNANRDQRFMIF